MPVNNLKTKDLTIRKVYNNNNNNNNKHDTFPISNNEADKNKTLK